MHATLITRNWRTAGFNYRLKFVRRNADIRIIFRAALSHRFLLLLSSPALPPMAVRSVCRAGRQLQCIRPAAARRPPRASGVAVIPRPPACNVRSILPARHCPPAFLHSCKNHRDTLAAKSHGGVGARNYPFQSYGHSPCSAPPAQHPQWELFRSSQVIRSNQHNTPQGEHLCYTAPRPNHRHQSVSLPAPPSILAPQLGQTSAAGIESNLRTSFDVWPSHGFPFSNSLH